MESWSYINGGGKGFVTSNDHITSLPSKNSMMGWGMKSPCGSNIGNGLLVSGHSWTESHGFGDLSMPESMTKQTLIDSTGHSHAKFGDGRVMNPIMATANAFSGEDESNSRVSSSVVDSNSSSLIDLKLGRLADQRDHVNNSKDYYRGTPPKRPRMGGVNSHVAYCQVYGCNKDLSASKDYHRRHKVCEIHSKTAKVIVNGIEKRFCQQCSRFHLLAEFDDGKRSCRKRLAGHNERRRKPHAGVHSGRTGRFLQSCNGFTGSRFPGTSLTATSFICQDIFQRGLLHPEKYGTTTDWYQNVKSEQGTDYSHLSANGPYYSNLSDDLKKPFPNTTSSVSVNESSCRYPHPGVGPNSGLYPLAQDTSFFDTTSTMRELSSNIPEPGCALSLLSSQSHKSSSNHPSGIPMARPIMMPGSTSVGQFSDKLVGVASTRAASNKFSSSGISSVEGNHVGPMFGSDAVNFDIMYPRSDYMNAKDCLSCENGTTVDLLQLSSQLQRVENQRQSMQLKTGNNAFCCLRIT